VLKGLQGGGEGWLVDNLTDTGRTLHTVRRMLPNAHVATVYVKPEGRPLVDTFVTEVSQDTWILFPWDTDLTKTVPLARREFAQVATHEAIPGYRSTLVNALVESPEPRVVKTLSGGVLEDIMVSPG